MRLIHQVQGYGLVCKAPTMSTCDHQHCMAQNQLQTNIELHPHNNKNKEQIEIICSFIPNEVEVHLLARASHLFIPTCTGASCSFKSLVIDAVGATRGMLVTPTASMTGFKRPNLLHSPCAYIHVCILSYIQQPLCGVGYRIFAVQYTYTNEQSILSNLQSNGFLQLLVFRLYPPFLHEATCNHSLQNSEFVLGG